jgi:hypothetical protein
MSTRKMIACNQPRAGPLDRLVADLATKPASPCTLRAPKRQPAQPVGRDLAIFHFGNEKNLL